ncbi:MAG: aldo/keto reductase [Dehalococcoidia bacterium]|nr:aldo/keto reductase [Dehalococcoidia bacterium]
MVKIGEQSKIIRIKEFNMPNLEIRRLGRTEMKPKALGLGCGYLGDPRRPDEEAVATIRAAIKHGINFIDTSPEYGVSEYRVGLALAEGWREKIYLQTKVGSHPRFLRDFSKEATIWSLENSFRLLQTDYVDSVLIHGPRYDIETPLGACLDTLVDWKMKGRIGNIGIGVRQHEFHCRAIETGEMDIVLSFLDYTLLSQSVAETTIPLALKNDIGIILASPLSGSLLAGPEPDVQRAKDLSSGPDRILPPSLIGGPTDPDVLPYAHKMWQWCKEQDLNIRDLALQFVLNAPVEGNGIVLSGPANQKEFSEIYASATKKIPENSWQGFEAAFGVNFNY